MRFPDLDRLGVDLAGHHRAVRDMMARFAQERLAPTRRRASATTPSRAI